MLLPEKVRAKLESTKIILIDRCALVVREPFCDSVTVGHIPKFMSKLTSFFLKHGGHIKFEITGGMKCSKDLEQGRLEIPARLTISSTNKK